MTGRPTDLTRRAALRAGALAVLAVPLAACGPGYDETPDPLQPLLAAADADAAAAKALAKGDDAAGQLAAARAAHAAALKSEVDRLNRPKPSPSAAPPAPAALGDLKDRLAAARKQAEDLVGGLPRYRAGLVAAVAAGCAALQRIDPALGPGEDAPKVGVAPGGAVPAEAVDPLQTALAAEHAAVWVYGLVGAFLPADFGDGEKSGAAEHALRRDYLQTTLAASGATPVAPEAAYVPKNPVTDTKSASQVVATAEADCASAWLAVVNHTDDAGLRTTALHALVAASRRGTPWRSEAGEKPTAIAMPGQAS
ncbi:ferritin-like domain-containing protein [Amycolatopsis sp. FBCC-B4732]|uniref:ferritin-like domain-containing protein n=1 Tax=Amycolatopsis sp. FBCC-B4732 TaxID=3079339 RepID=UPI001FF4F35B|nr:ferritin-like domain-containing protein [Amycolatopsis sp. FBCC-B4732]UOX89886.1 ferritin-like domain-containing protein [Amycolatopsis sp. FBCC-B4732]